MSGSQALLMCVCGRGGQLAWFWGGGQTCLHLQKLNQVLALPEVSGPMASPHPLVLCECRILALGDGLSFSAFAQAWLLFLYWHMLT